MAELSRIYSERPVSVGVNEALNAFDEAIRIAVDAVKASDVPQGLVVAILAAHAHEQTARLLHMREGN